MTRTVLASTLTLTLTMTLTLAIAVRADGPSPKPGGPTTDAEREAVALAFVGAHHPELAALLAELKPMRPSEYAKAMRELAQVSRSMTELESRDPKRHELGLDVWKTRSRVELLTARLASAPAPGPWPELEGQLRQAVEAQVDAQTRQQRHERDQAEARLRQLDQNLRRLESDRDAIVAARVKNLLEKGRKASASESRNGNGSSARTKSKAKDKAKATTTQNRTQGERLR